MTQLLFDKPTHSQAASFILAEEIRNYFELELGGKDAFQQLIKEGVYSPYVWKVRHFKEGEKNETTKLYRKVLSSSSIIGFACSNSPSEEQ